jgi:hypothetical protein
VIEKLQSVCRIRTTTLSFNRYTNLIDQRWTHEWRVQSWRHGPQKKFCNKFLLLYT